MVFNDAMVEISMTLVATYLTFYVAEDLLHVSGVLAVVVLGVAMSAMASNRISPEVHHPMHIFWEMMEYFANTIIFVYSGLIIALEIYRTRGEQLEDNEVESLRLFDSDATPMNRTSDFLLHDFRYISKPKTGPMQFCCSCFSRSDSPPCSPYSIAESCLVDL